MYMSSLTQKVKLLGLLLTIDMYSMSQMHTHSNIQLMPLSSKSHRHFTNKQKKCKWLTGYRLVGD